MKKLMILLLLALMLLGTASVAYAGPTENTVHVAIPDLAKDAGSPACANTDADPCSGMGASAFGRLETANDAIPGP